MLSIPYDPALVLGNLVDENLLKAVLAVSQAAAPADSAQEALNSLILSKRSIDMTIDELTTMGIDPREVITASGKLGDEIAKAAVTFANANIKAQQDILKAKGARASVPVSAHVESPIDYNKTEIKQMPLSADSIKLDAQYFSNDENEQGSSNTISTIKAYVSEATGFLGTESSFKAAAAAQSQVSSQYQNHNVAGTLVITSGCTHKNAVLLAPFVVDPDKAIRVWNAVFPDDPISTDHPEQMVTVVMRASAKEANERALKLISGATYGSSFVGMVHILRKESTRTSQAMYSLASNLQSTITVNLAAEYFKGGFGVDTSFANDLKHLLSQQEITSHCSLITMGSIPSIKSNSVRVGVKQFLEDEFNGKKMMENLSALQNATAGEIDSVSAAAEAARTKGEMAELKATQVRGVMIGLGALDEAQNKMLDINSLMTAFEDYVDKALAGNIGVPINYYLKTINKAALPHLWVSKSYPQYLAISEDDSGRGGPAPTPQK